MDERSTKGENSLHSTCDELIVFVILAPTRTSSVVVNKQKSLPNTQSANVKSKEKSVSDHMTIAQKKLTHFQNTQPTKSSNKPKEKSRLIHSLLTV